MRPSFTIIHTNYFPISFTTLIFHLTNVFQTWDHWSLIIFIRFQWWVEFLFSTHCPKQNTTSHNQPKNQKELWEGESSKAPIPADSDSTDDVHPWIGYPPSDRELVSHFLFTSDEESSEDEYGDPTFLPPSTPKRPQNRPRRSNPQHPKDREVVLGLTARKNGVSAEEGRWRVLIIHPVLAASSVSSCISNGQLSLWKRKTRSRKHGVLVVDCLGLFLSMKLSCKM